MSESGASFFDLLTEIRDKIYDNIWKDNEFLHVEYGGTCFWLQHRQPSSRRSRVIRLDKYCLVEEFDDEFWHRCHDGPFILLAGKRVRQEALAELVRNAAWRIANDHLNDWESVHWSAQTQPVKIENVEDTSSWKNHTFDITISLYSTDVTVRKKTNAYRTDFAHREVNVRNPRDEIQRLCATSRPRASTVRHLALTLILAFRPTGPWIFVLDDLYHMASALPALCTATVCLIPSPEHEHRYFRRSIKYDQLPARNEGTEAAYPAILDLGKALFGEKGVTCEEVG